MKGLKQESVAQQLESVRWHMMGELMAYEEQFCPECRQHKPRFNGSRMFDGSRSEFGVCRDCR